MSRKNYLRELKSCEQKQHSGRKASLRDYLEALLDFMRKPKTRFDLKDRSILLVLLVLVIIVLQKVVQSLSN